MKVQSQIHGTVAVLRPHGPLIAEELPDLRRALESTATNRPSHVVVDMGDIPYVDSSGIEFLLETCDAAFAPLPRPASPAGPRAIPKRVKLAALTDTCREALDLTNVLPRIEVFDTVDNAIRSCGSGFKPTPISGRVGSKPASAGSGAGSTPGVAAGGANPNPASTSGRVDSKAVGPKPVPTRDVG
jgi:hypothetical protein